MPTNERHARVTGSDIRHLGELSKSEIRVWLFLRFCRNDRTGRCDPSRAVIGDGTGLLKSHVAEAVAGLETKGWTIETADGFSFPNQELSAAGKVPESGTKSSRIRNKPEPTKFPNQEQKVPDSAQKVPDSGTPLNIVSLTTKTTKGTDKPLSRKRDRGSGDVQKVFDYYKTVHEKTDRFTLTAERRKAIEGRLVKYSVADIFDAINGCKVSRTHQGDNDRETVYDDIELICRNDTKLEKFIEIYNRRAQFAGGGGNRKAGEKFGSAPVPDPNAETGDIDDRLFVPSATMRPAPDLPASIAAVWAKTKAALAKQFSPEVMRNWFEGIVFDGLDKTDRRLLLRAGQANADWVRIYYADALDNCLAAGGLDGYKIAWEVDNGECEPAQLRAAL